MGRGPERPPHPPAGRRPTRRGDRPLPAGHPARTGVVSSPRGSRPGAAGQAAVRRSGRRHRPLSRTPPARGSETPRESRTPAGALPSPAGPGRPSAPASFGARTSRPPASAWTRRNSASSRSHYATAARLYAEALAATPRLTEDLRAGHRFNAARAAALAGVRSRRRRGRARGAGAEGVAQPGARVAATRPGRLGREGGHGHRSADRIQARRALSPWRDEPDLAGLRDADALDRLPPAERQECRALWREVAGRAPSCRNDPVSPRSPLPNARLGFGGASPAPAARAAADRAALWASGGPVTQDGGAGLPVPSARSAVARFNPSRLTR